jgi:hypothetical protein
MGGHCRNSRGSVCRILIPNGVRSDPLSQLRAARRGIASPVMGCDRRTRTNSGGWCERAGRAPSAGDRRRGAPDPGAARGLEATAAEGASRPRRDRPERRARNGRVDCTPGWPCVGSLAYARWRTTGSTDSRWDTASAYALRWPSCTTRSSCLWTSPARVLTTRTPRC